MTKSAPKANPHDVLVDLGAERAVLGNALLEATAVPLVADVPAGLYYKDSHRAIAEAIQRLAKTGATVEPATLSGFASEGRIGGPLPTDPPIPAAR